MYEGADRAITTRTRATARAYGYHACRRSYIKTVTLSEPDSADSVLVVVLVVCVRVTMSVIESALPTLYEYYTAGGIQTGLTAAGSNFKLNGRNITLYSGAIHYFRVPRPHWKDRLKKLRAAGFNAVETYVPWNLHEPQPGIYDWGDGGTDMQDYLHLQEYIRLAQEEDLLVIVRPGPYICSEWEFGGFPSWLLREQDIKVRTSDEKFMKHVTRYFNILLSLLSIFQFTKGGPIIAFQIENEYGSTQVGNKPVDKQYLTELQNLMVRNGIVELLFTSDSPVGHADAGSLPGVLQTANFQSDPEKEFGRLKQLQPDRPLMCMEYWTGWFDHWSEKHHMRSTKSFSDVLVRILNYPASVNMYMFHGGTNWGFMNGANIGDGSTDNKGFQPDTTSYDYDALLNEAGDYTEKYVEAKKIIMERNNLVRHPLPPSLVPRKVYHNVNITDKLDLFDIETQVSNKINSAKLLSMENLPINNNTGQSYGYIVYKTRANIPANSILQILGRVCDTVMVVVNGVLKSKPLKTNSDLNGFGFWRVKDSTLNLGPVAYEDATVELIVENWGRNNFGSLTQFRQFKGLWQGNVTLNGNLLGAWEIIPLEFRTSWTTSLQGWKPATVFNGPALYKGTFQVDQPSDTYLDMSSWTKGIVIVNGFVLGRYAVIGPQLSLYLPSSHLKAGANEIVIFEHYQGNHTVPFSENAKFASDTTYKLPFN